MCIRDSLGLVQLAIQAVDAVGQAIGSAVRTKELRLWEGDGEALEATRLRLDVLAEDPAAVVTTQLSSTQLNSTQRNSTHSQAAQPSEWRITAQE